MKKRTLISPGLLLTVVLGAAIPPAPAARVEAAKTPKLETILDRAGDRVELFWRQFSSVSCTETVEQVKLSEKDKPLNRRQAEYDYVIFMQLTGKELRVEESRRLTSETRPKKKKRPSQRSLLLTSGFPIMMLIFHPQFQDRYLFQLAAGPDDGPRPGLTRIDFEQVAGAESLSVLRLKDRDYPLAWAGTAWVEAGSGAIVRIRTKLREPLTEVGLRSLTSDVWYSDISFTEATESYRLPERAEVDARSRGQHWHNIHTFTAYKRFSVNTEVTIGGTQ